MTGENFKAASGSPERFEGVFALLLTPFQHNGDIDWNVYDQYVDWQLGRNASGIFAVCGSSEMGLLSLDERLQLASRAVKRAGEVPVIATANVSPDLQEHEEELQRMAETGVTAVVLIPPTDLGKDQERLGEYFAKLTDRSPVPVFLYECPLYRPHFIDAGVYKELVTRHGVVGVKDTTCTMEGINAKIAAGGIVYQANTAFMLESIFSGARGIMAITSTAAADVVVKLWEKARQRDPEASSIHAQLVALDALLGKAYTATAKYLVSLRGIPMSSYTRSSKELAPAIAKSMEVWLQSINNN